MAEITTKERVPYRIWDKTNNLWNELKFKTNANSVDANDGDNMETKVGAIKGITTSTEVTEEGYAADATVVAALNSSLGEHPTFVYDEEGKITGYTTKIGGADTVFPFNTSSMFEGELVLTGDTSKLTVIDLPRKPTAVFLRSITNVRIIGFYLEKEDINEGNRNAISIDGTPFTVTDNGFVFDSGNGGTSYCGKCYYFVSYD